MVLALSCSAKDPLLEASSSIENLSGVVGFLILKPHLPSFYYPRPQRKVPDILAQNLADTAP